MTFEEYRKNCYQHNPVDDCMLQQYHLGTDSKYAECNEEHCPTWHLQKQINEMREHTHPWGHPKPEMRKP